MNEALKKQMQGRAKRQFFYGNAGLHSKMNQITERTENVMKLLAIVTMTEGLSEASEVAKLRETIEEIQKTVDKIKSMCGEADCMTGRVIKRLKHLKEE
jgi:hypothetical protein